MSTENPPARSAPNLEHHRLLLARRTRLLIRLFELEHALVDATKKTAAAEMKVFEGLNENLGGNSQPPTRAERYQALLLAREARMVATERRDRLANYLNEFFPASDEAMLGRSRPDALWGAIGDLEHADQLEAFVQTGQCAVLAAWVWARTTTP